MNRVIYLGPSHALRTAQEVLEPRWTVVAPNPSREAVLPHLNDAVAILDASMKVRFDGTMLSQASRATCCLDGNNRC